MKTGCSLMWFFRFHQRNLQNDWALEVFRKKLQILVILLDIGNPFDTIGHTFRNKWILYEIKLTSFPKFCITIVRMKIKRFCWWYFIYLSHTSWTQNVFLNFQYYLKMKNLLIKNWSDSTKLQAPNVKLEKKIILDEDNFSILYRIFLSSKLFFT